MAASKKGAAVAAPAPAPAAGTAPAAGEGAGAATSVTPITETTGAGTTPAPGSAGAVAPDASTTPTPPAGPDVEVAAGAPTFPLRVVLRNHTSLAITEPITGAFLPGGGSATVTLHDEDHAEQVADSLMNIVESNFLTREALAVEPA